VAYRKITAFVECVPADTHDTPTILFGLNAHLYNSLTATFPFGLHVLPVFHAYLIYARFHQTNLTIITLSTPILAHGLSCSGGDHLIARVFPVYNCFASPLQYLGVHIIIRPPSFVDRSSVIPLYPICHTSVSSHAPDSYPLFLAIRTSSDS